MAISNAGMIRRLDGNGGGNDRRPHLYMAHGHWYCVGRGYRTCRINRNTAVEAWLRVAFTTWPPKRA